MSEKYISVWVWMINGIIAVVTIIFANNFLINPESDWTLKINQIPDVTQIDLHTDFELHRKGEIQTGRTVSDPAWRVLDKFNMNQLELPPVPEKPEEPDKPVVVDEKPPTIEEAREDLLKRIRIDGIIAPYSAEALLLDTGMTVMLIPYQRLNPNIKDDIQLSDQHNYYDDMTEIGLPAKCISIHPEGVIFDYDFTKGKFTQNFRILVTMQMVSPEVYAVYEKFYGSEMENKEPDGSNPGATVSNNNSNNPREYPGSTTIDPNTGAYRPGRDDIEQFNKNFERELTGLGLTTVRNKDGKPEGVRITVEPKEGSLPQKYGMKKNDTIISINSVPINSVAEGRKWVTNNPDESSYTVVYIRNGKEMTRTIQNPNK